MHFLKSARAQLQPQAMLDPIRCYPIRADAGAESSRAGPGAVSASPANLNYCWLCRQAGRQVGRLAAHTYRYALKQIYSRLRLVYGAGTGCQSGQFNVAVMLNARPII